MVSPSGIHATLSIGIGRGGANLSEALQFASLAEEMALSRGGDQAVIKNRFGFDFIGGKSVEGESSNKVRSRVMANALESLIKDASRVLVMGHRFSDMDSIGGAVGVCSIARKNGVPVNIVADTEKTSAKPLIKMIRSTPEYKDAFINGQEAMLIANSKTLLVVVDTNRPEQVEDLRLLQSCNHVAVIDHHRRAATYIDRADLSFIEPYASSVCELMTEILEMLGDAPKLCAARQRRYLRASCSIPRVSPSERGIAPLTRRRTCAVRARIRWLSKSCCKTAWSRLSQSTRYCRAQGSTGEWRLPFPRRRRTG